MGVLASRGAASTAPPEGEVEDVKDTASWLRALGIALVFLALGCSRASTPGASGVEEGALSSALCPDSRTHTGLLPGVREEHRRLDYWLARPELAATLDEPLMSAQARRAHHAFVLSQPLGSGRLRVDVSAPLDAPTELATLNARFASFREEFGSGKYFHADGKDAADLVQGRLQDLDELAPEFGVHLAREVLLMRCAPWQESFYSSSLDVSFDRNNCSALHPGEPFVVVGEVSGMLAVRAAYAFGFIAADSPMTPALDAQTAHRFVHGEMAEVRRDIEPLRRAETVALAEERWPEEGDVWVEHASASGVIRTQVPVEALRPHAQPLTRRAFLEYIFEMQGEPYAWGDEGGGRDCSRLVMDSLDVFGVRMPRHSASQSYAGDFYVDVEGVSDEEKLKILDAANARGIVLLHFPGHIMIYLGRDDEGAPMAFHTFAEYFEPCPEGTQTAAGDQKSLVRVHTTDVTTLALGGDTERTSFLSRVNRIAVVGGTPGWALDALATERPALPPEIPDGTCEDSDAFALFSAPYHANTESVTRLIFAAEDELGPVAMTLRSPSGEIIHPELERRVGPPWAFLASVELDEVGTWRLAVGDGPSVYACRDIRVRRGSAALSASGEGSWPVRNAWSRRYENLFSIFVHELTRYPLEEGRAWGNLQDLLQVQEKNILYEYLGRNEETKIALQPDCADLPYVLRAYFAWKLGLPFAHRSCNRGREGRPPTCGELKTNAEPRVEADAVDEFQRYARRVVMSGVHSGNGRTAPENSQTDLYPVPLTREALRPGIVYADPDGHVMMIAGWLPQPLGGYGVLYAVDAQPDGTIGLRPFWRGTFAFRAETDSVGAGFKAFRPIVIDRQGQWSSLDNEALHETSWFYPFSMQAYEGDDDAFYDAMDALINPRPIEPWGVLQSRLDSLEASVRARLRAVQLGVDHMNGARWRNVPMPKGYGIFETSGPWEDFATPSRDMRLLAAIDATVKFVDGLARNASHYGLRPEELEAAQTTLRQALEAELGSRTVEYTRSDGSAWTLTLAQVVERAERLEVAYNLNDCPEYRWGAAEDSEEYTTCSQRADAEQQARLEEYRPWFSSRRRPAR